MPRSELIMERIPIAGPSITQLEIDYAADAAAYGWYDHAHEYPRRFEQAFASYIGVKHAVSLPSCTSSLHLAFAALGIGPGDEVLFPISPGLPVPRRFLMWVLHRFLPMWTKKPGVLMSKA